MRGAGGLSDAARDGRPGRLRVTRKRAQPVFSMFQNGTISGMAITPERVLR
jgi:hypothetical protein